MKTLELEQTKVLKAGDVVVTTDYRPDTSAIQRAIITDFLKWGTLCRMTHLILRTTLGSQYYNIPISR